MEHHIELWLGIGGIFATIFLTGVVLMVTDNQVWGVFFIVISLMWLVLGFTWMRRKSQSKVALPNQVNLFLAIAELQQTASDLLEKCQNRNQLDRARPNLVHVDEMNIEQEAQSKYNKAKESLQKERLVAGRGFYRVIDKFISSVESEIATKADLISGQSAIRQVFQKLAEDTTTSIGLLVGGRDRLAKEDKND